MVYSPPARTLTDLVIRPGMAPENRSFEWESGMGLLIYILDEYMGTLLVRGG